MTVDFTYVLAHACLELYQTLQRLPLTLTVCWPPVGPKDYKCKWIDCNTNMLQLLQGAECATCAEGAWVYVPWPLQTCALVRTQLECCLWA